MKIDEIDAKIVQHLQRNARISLTALGEQVCLSAPAVKKRMLKLESEGFICSYKAVIDKNKAQMNVLGYMGLSLRNHSNQSVAQVFDILGRHQGVINGCKVAGSFDYLVQVATYDMPAYLKLKEALISELALDKLQIFMVMEEMRPANLIDLSYLLNPATLASKLN